MGMTAIEKALARASGLPQVKPGDIVFPKPDHVVVHDNIVSFIKEELDKVGATGVYDPEKVHFVTDHDVVYTNPRVVERGALIRKVVKEWGITNHWDVNQGGHGHVFPMVEGIVSPGTFYMDCDRHCTNVGGIGAVAIRVGWEQPTLLVTGTLWTKVPRTIKVNLRGKVKTGVFGRDIGFRLVQELQRQNVDIDYRCLEMAGDLDQLNLDQRVAICSSPTEARAISVFFPPSEEILAYARERAKKPFTPIYSDPDAVYEREFDLDLDAIEPQVVKMGGVENGVDVSELAGTPINHAFIGSCSSGMYEDLVAAATMLKGRKVAPGVRLFIVPGSQASLKRAQREGLMDIFIDAGAMVMPSGCGLCSGGKMGPVNSGEVSISTAANNEAGRFGGAKDAELFLASPATVAASAVEGKIVDPRHFQGFSPVKGN